MTSPTTHQGNIGQTAVMLDALKRGYHVSVPLEGAAYDLVVDQGTKLIRVQVRSASSIDGKLKVRLRYSTSACVDVIAMYDLSTSKVYWVPFDKIQSTTQFFIYLDDEEEQFMQL